MKTWFLISIGFMLMSFSGCGREKVVEPTNTRDLIGSWKLVDSSPYQVTMVVEPLIQTHNTLPAQTFGVSGMSSVNQYNSTLSYQAADQTQIAIASISSTKKGGSAEAMAFEQTYYTHLKAVERYELTDQNRLTFYYNGGVLVYEK